MVPLACNNSMVPIPYPWFPFHIHGSHSISMVLIPYPWFPMPATIHKVLIHVKEILENSVLPAGYFREEASETRNKFYKRDREFYARKNSRKNNRSINNLEYIFNRAIDTSDPVISSISLQYSLKRRHKLTLPSEVIAMLSPPQVLIVSSTSAINVVASSEDKDEDDSDKETGPLDYLELDSE